MIELLPLFIGTLCDRELRAGSLKGSAHRRTSLENPQAFESGPNGKSLLISLRLNNSPSSR